MDQYFLFVYFGNDSKFKFRILDQDGFGEELDLENIELFKYESTSELIKNNKTFEIYHPYGGSRDHLDFVGLQGLFDGHVRDTSVEEMVNNCNTESPVLVKNLYDSALNTAISFAMKEKRSYRLQ